MDALEAKLVAVPSEVIDCYLNDAARLLHLQHFKAPFEAPEVMISARKQALAGSLERLMREIQSRNISVSPSDLSTYLIKVACNIYRQREYDFQAQQRIMPAEEAISGEAVFPSVYKMVEAQRYELLVEKTLSGEFELVPKGAGK